MREPKKPVKGQKAIRYEVLTSTSDRFHYFQKDDEWEEDDEEELGLSPHQSISLRKVLKILETKKISPDDIYFTVHLSDDYIVLQVVNEKKLSYQEQLKEYEVNKAEWDAQQAEYTKQMLHRNQLQMERLQQENEILNKKLGK